MKSRHPGHEEEKSLKGASPLAKRCGVQALGFESSFFRYTDEAMAAERFPTPRDQVRFLASVPRGRSTTAVCQLCKLSGVGSNPIASTASDG